MTIAILSPRLANQIAAGEVVERPASVVKELVENAIDAGATEIIIEIEQGGSKLIQIRDNGCGVAKEELALALSRHATSKISTLDDLEAIESLGFRGEALASISSVCRLTFTSKTAEQHEAWQAYAQGRDMAVEIVPASHPNGTTVAVADMFFNTPARRRFLRTEKTEFNHIDELIKRFALSHFDIQFVLKHNGKTLRQLHGATTVAQQERRVGTLCSKGFIDNAIAITSEHNDIKLSGWLVLPQGCKSYSDSQFCYVNGRMMRDKLINHAIRQAYQYWLPEGVVPSYILYIEIGADQVDVNVHPAKHEVRFHQARMVHDLIYQVLNSGLNQALGDNQQSQPANLETAPAASSHDYGHAQSSAISSATSSAISSGSSAATNYSPGRKQSYASVKDSYQGQANPAQLAEAARSYQSLMTTSPHSVALPQVAASSELFGVALSVIEQRFLLVKQDQNLGLLSLSDLAKNVNYIELQANWAQGLRGQPLLLPIAISLDSSLVEQINLNQQLFRRLGIEIVYRSPQIIVKQVPGILRNQDLVSEIPNFLQILKNAQQLEQAETELAQVVCHWLSQFVAANYSMVDAMSLLEKADNYHNQLQAQCRSLVKPVDFTSLIAQFN